MAVTGRVKPLGKKILIHNMDFGEQVTKSGIVIQSDNGKAHGVKPRWGQVWAVGPEHNEPFNVGDWILVEHGRWSRGIEYENEDGTKTTIRLVDNDCIMLWDTEKPNEVYIGQEFGNGDSINIRPDDFLR